MDHDGHARLTDFGLDPIDPIVRGMSSIVASESDGHTPGWAASEVLNGADEITPEASMVVIEVGPGFSSR